MSAITKSQNVRSPTPCRADADGALLQMVQDKFSLSATGEILRRTSWGRKKAGDCAKVYCDSRGYLAIGLRHPQSKETITLRVHRVVFALYNNRWPSCAIDHINGDRRDNRPSNLREATAEQNAQNRGVHSNNLSGYIGVVAERRKSKTVYTASYWVRGKHITIGRFDDPELAALVRDECVLRLRGEFARLNTL